MCGTRRKTRKKGGLYPKNVDSSSKISAFPRQIRLSPEKPDVFRTVKVPIFKCPKPGGFKSRCLNIFFVCFQGKLFASLFKCIFNMFSCSTGRRFWRQPSLNPPKKIKKIELKPAARARARVARGRTRVSTPSSSLARGKPVWTRQGRLPREARRKQPRPPAKPESGNRLRQAATAARARAPPGRAPTRNAF